MNADHIAVLKDMMADYGATPEREALAAAISSLSVAQGQGWREQIGPDDHVAVITNTPYGRGVWFNSEAACAEFCKWPFSSEPPTPAAPAQPDGME